MALTWNGDLISMMADPKNAPGSDDYPIGEYIDYTTLPDRQKSTAGAVTPSFKILAVLAVVGLGVALLMKRK